MANFQETSESEIIDNLECGFVLITKVGVRGKSIIDALGHSDTESEWMSTTENLACIQSKKFFVCDH